VSITRIAALSTALALGACSQKYSFDDWPDASHLISEEELPELSPELLQGMKAADDFLAVFSIGHPLEEQFATWILFDEALNEWLDPNATPESMPGYVQDVRSRFLAWHRGKGQDLDLLEAFIDAPPFISLGEGDLGLLLQLYQQQPEIREAWFHLAQMQWNQGNDVVHENLSVVIWKALAGEGISTREERQEWLAKYPLNRRVSYLRLAKGLQDWSGFWSTAPHKGMVRHFPDGPPLEENQRIVRMIEKLLAAPAPGHGEPGLSAEELAWLKTTAFFQALEVGMQCLGTDSWLPWMVPEDGK